ncbi:hypothetical protein [Duganella callida]|uniref:Transmembrane protein n=1 Tax=Duganella callida TaxID=2561932 RepID=A0A4Y9SC32_9BURK|nr:hypothetical protein [Duganella callida]TFW17904.1 hypothetical protein E4L98_19610 [Duganella callida]
MHRKLALVLLLTASLSACSPKYDWRDYRSPDAPYAILFPGKPATQTRAIHLGQLETKMTMAATEIDGVVFAVGSAQLADATQAPAALEAMKTAMISNIGATITSSRQLPNGALEIDASGSRNGHSMRLTGRFLSSGKRLYQVVVIGPAGRVDADTVDTYLSSFKLN